MSSTNTSGRPSGYISIPVEIIPPSKSHSRNNSPFRPLRNDNPYGDFSNSPPWKSSINSHSTGRFQPRQSPTAAYDRVIHNSQFNQRPAYQEPQYRPSQQRLYEPSPLHYSRSSEDLLSSPMDSTRSSTQSQYTSFHPPSFTHGFRSDSDFIQPKKYTSSLRRSYDALNDFPDMQQNFSANRQYPSNQQQQQPNYRSTYQTQHRPTYTNQTFINPDVVYTNEYGVPTNTFQTTSNKSHDRSRSPGSQRSESPVRPPPTPASQQQQQQESDLPQAKDATGPIPMSGPATTSSFVQSNDQQVPSTDSSASAAPIRDPNTIALEKLEQIKQSLAEFNQQVDVFTGSTRDDRLYKLLDEQALKIMIRCDELIDVSADIKEKRKEMIRNVQTILAKLESKVPTAPVIEYNSNQMETAIVAYDPSINNTNTNEQKESSTTEQSIST